MFGMGYTIKESLVLPDGEYEFMIQRVTEKQTTDGANYIDVEVSAKGKNGYNPRHITYFDRPKIGEMKNSGISVTAEDVEKWDKQMTILFDCFSITRGDFEFTRWRGKTGICKVITRKDGFKSIFPKNPETGSIPESVKAVQQTFGGTVESPGQNTSEDFPEDIPF